MVFDQVTLPNGLRIIGERITHYRSVSVGLWIGSGSQYEYTDEAGLSHFLEHMVFKGTERRTARQIAREMDAVGGLLDAFTARDCTCFSAKVVDEDLPLALDIIADMVCHPAFDPAEMEKEKGVVIEEINMAEDTPEDVAYDLLFKAYFGDQPLARPILGRAERIRSCTREELRAYWAHMYRPQNAVLAIVGHYEWDAVLRLAEAMFGGWQSEGFDRHPFSIAPAPLARLSREKDIEQVHIALGYPAVDQFDPHYMDLSIVNNVFGGAMSSRLFQRIREESGMAYSVYSMTVPFQGAGMLLVYAATSADTAQEVVRMVREEAQRMADEGLSEAEFTMTRQQLRAGFLLGLESTMSRMNVIGRRMIIHNRMPGWEALLARVEQTKLENVNAMAREVLSAPCAMAMVGKGAPALMEGMEGNALS